MARVTLTIVTILCLLQAVRVLGDRFNNSEIGTFAPTSNTYFDSRCQTKVKSRAANLHSLLSRTCPNMTATSSRRIGERGNVGSRPTGLCGK
jgi:hypothetical protein